MTREPIQYQKTDAWLLTAVIWASLDHLATLSEIIQNGDHINHTPFTDEELNGGLLRLILGGWISGGNDSWTATPQATAEYEEIKKTGSSVYDHMKALGDILKRQS